MTEEEAKALAAPHVGVTVNRRHRDKPNSWRFEARFHSASLGFKTRYAGRDLNRAISLYAELVDVWSKRSPNYEP